MNQAGDILGVLLLLWTTAAFLGSLIGFGSFFFILDVFRKGPRARRWFGAGLLALSVSLLCGGTLMAALFACLLGEDVPIGERVTNGLLLLGLIAMPAVCLGLVARRQWRVCRSSSRSDGETTV